MGTSEMYKQSIELMMLWLLDITTIWSSLLLKKNVVKY